MLANVLNSEQAINASIRIVEIFIRMREMIQLNRELLRKLEKLEQKVINQDEKIAIVYKYLKRFVDIRDRPRKEVGFKRKGQKE